MSSIRVLQVLASLDRGGAESMVMTLYRNIDRNLVQFDFLVNDQPLEYAFEPEIRAMGGRVFRIPRYKLVNHLSYKKAWRQLLEINPEWKVIHVHHTTPAAVCIPIAKSLNKKTIVHSHIAGRDNNLKAVSKMGLRYPLRYLADYLFAASGLAAKWMFGSKCDKTHILKNSIEVKRFLFCADTRQRTRNALNLEKRFVVGHIGRFDKQKNHRFLLEIFKEISKVNQNARLLLVGDGYLKTKIERRANLLGIKENVLFAGVRSDVPDLLQAMDAFLFPSLYEGLGVVLVEAQAAGLKCFTSAGVVPSEAKVTGLLEFLSLDKTASFWAEKVLGNALHYEREVMFDQISAAGYDAMENARWLQGFYLKVALVTNSSKLTHQ